MADLKPCPFCGGDARMESGGPGCHYVRCDDCGACSDDGSQERASGLWNTRAERALAERAGGVKVKALEWKTLREGESYAAVGASITYRVVKAALSATAWSWYRLGAHQNECESFEAARAAAQADFEHCALSTLTTEPAAPEGRQEDGHTDADGYPYEYTRPAEQAVTEAMVEDTIMPVIRQVLADYAHENRKAAVWELDVRITSALKAAIEAGR